MNMIRKIIIVLFSLCLIIIPNAMIFADSGYSEAYDSFAVSEEYQTMAEGYDLVGLMQEKYPEMDDGKRYQPQYQAIFVEWYVNGSFHSYLKEGKIVLNENTVYDPHLYVPIVDGENGLAAMYACIEIDAKSVTFLKGNGNCLTKESIDEIRGESALGYTFLRFSTSYHGTPFLLAHTDTDDGIFYDCLYDNEAYTIGEMSRYLEIDAEKEADALKEMLGAVMMKLLTALVILVGGILLLLFLIWLTIHFYQKKKMKKKVQMLDTAEGKEST